VGGRQSADNVGKPPPTRNGISIMQAIELETEIDENHEIHLKLPDEVRAGKAIIVVLYERRQMSASRENSVSFVAK